MGTRRKDKPLPQSRNQRRGAAGPSPLLAVAGLPASTALAAANTINNDKETRWRAVASVFPQSDGIYSEQTVTALMRRVCAFAIRDERDAEGLVDPSRIVLAYVETPCSEALWEGFGHSVWPIRLSHPEWNWPNGRHWRFDQNVVNALLRQAIAVAESPPVNALRYRLEARSVDDPLLLPGRNFSLGGGDTLSSRYMALLRGEITHDVIDAEVVRKKFPFERLSKFYKKTGGKNKVYAVDNRALVFAKAHVGQDGGQHLIEAGQDMGQKRLRRELEGRYRFGTPLLPAGFQHDVQWADDVLLERVSLTCSDLGAVRVSGDHANVFGNDVVKASTVIPERE